MTHHRAAGITWCMVLARRRSGELESGELDRGGSTMGGARCAVAMAPWTLPW